MEKFKDRFQYYWDGIYIWVALCIVCPIFIVFDIIFEKISKFFCKLRGDKDDIEGISDIGKEI